MVALKAMSTASLWQTSMSQEPKQVRTCSRFAKRSSSSMTFLRNLTAHSLRSRSSPRNRAVVACVMKNVNLRRLSGLFVRLATAGGFCLSACMLRQKHNRTEGRVPFFQASPISTTFFHFFDIFFKNPCLRWAFNPIGASTRAAWCATTTQPRPTFG